MTDAANKRVEAVGEKLRATFEFETGVRMKRLVAEKLARAAIAADPVPAGVRSVIATVLYRSGMNGTSAEVDRTADEIVTSLYGKGEGRG